MKAFRSNIFINSRLSELFRKFLVDRTSLYDYSNKETDLINRYFDNNLQPNFQFYKDFITNFQDINHKVTIPSEILNSIQDRNSKDFYQFLSNLSDGQIQHYILSFADKTSNKPDKFFYDGQLTYQPYYLLKDIALMVLL